MLGVDPDLVGASNLGEQTVMQEVTSGLTALVDEIVVPAVEWQAYLPGGRDQQLAIVFAQSASSGKYCMPDFAETVTGSGCSLGSSRGLPYAETPTRLREVTSSS